MHRILNFNNDIKNYIYVCFPNWQVIFHKMQNIIENMKCVLELKSKIKTSEEQGNKLQEYVKMLKDMIHKSSNYHTLISNINSELNTA